MGANPHQPGGSTSTRRRDIRLVGVAAAAISAAVLVAGCASGPAGPGVASAAASATGSAASSTGGDYSQEVAYAACIRSHGEPNFPDPNPNGGFNISINANDPRLLAAERACFRYAPGGGQGQTAGRNFTPSQVAQLLKYAQCMRGHGILNFPDPTSKGLGSLSGIDLNSPQFAAASQACQHLMPNVGGNGPVTQQ